MLGKIVTSIFGRSPPSPNASSISPSQRRVGSDAHPDIHRRRTDVIPPGAEAFVQPPQGQYFASPPDSGLDSNIGKSQFVEPPIPNPPVNPKGSSFVYDPEFAAAYEQFLLQGKVAK